MQHILNADVKLKSGWKVGRVEGEGWKRGWVEGWKSGRLEEGWVEGWKDGGLYGWKKEAQSRMNVLQIYQHGWGRRKGNEG